MDQIFLLKLIASFVIGSLWITAFTIIAEKFGAKVGGVLAGIPSTAAIALFFIGWTQSPSVAAQSTTIGFIMLGVNAIFILIYCYLLRHNFYIAITVSILIWFLIAFGLVAIRFDNFVLSILCFFLLLPSAYIFIEYVLKIKTVKGQGYKFSFFDILFRSLLSGFVIAIAVVLTKFGGPIFGGLFAAFPAVFISTMLITNKTQGKVFSAGVMKILMISGLTNVFVYTMAVRMLYPVLGLMYGTLVAFIISLISAYFVLLFVKRIS